LRKVDPSSAGYDYTEAKQEYWHKPKTTGKALWTEPYFDEGAGNILMSTYSVPFHRNGKFLGIATVDIPLEPLRELVDIGISRDIKISVVTRAGKYLYSPHLGRINESIFEISQQNGKEAFIEFADDLTSGGSGIRKLTGWTSREPEWVFYAPVKSAHWGFAASMPGKNALAPVKEQFYRDLTFLIISLFLIAAALWFLSAQISRPIAKLNTVASEIARGNLTARADMARNDEIGILAESFNEMAQRLSEREEALRLSEEKYREITDNATEAILVAQDGVFQFANPKAEELFGYSAEELASGPLTSFLHEEDRELVGERHEKRLRGEILPSIYPFRIINKGGDTRWVELKVVVIPWNERPAALCFMNDITERKQAEEALLESENRFKTLFEFAPDAYYLNDLEGQFIDGNRAAEELSGYKKEEIIGKDLIKLDLMQPHELSKAAELLGKNIEGKSTGPDELTLKRKDGRQVAVEIRTLPINIKGQDIVLGIARDISERKKAEEARKELEAQLQRAQKMEAIGTLAGGVAHDLNNILSGIVSYPELLLMQLPEDSTLRKPVATMQESGKRAAAVVQDLLTLARRGVAVTEVVNLNAIISEYFLSPEYEKLKSLHSEVQVEVNLEKDLLNIMGAPVHLSKTIMNLVSNAAEAMPNGGEIIIYTENRYLDRPLSGYEDVEEGDYAVLKVSDTGVGISKKDQERIFEPFYTKKVMGRSGTGLGMAVVWGTMKDHKGYIDVESAEGKGSTFTLYFPVTRKKLPEEKPLVSIEEYKGRGEVILIVDDVDVQREIASTLLSQLGYSVVAVPSGEEAVEYIKGNKVDLLILDMIMDPGMDGLETYERILEICPGQKAIISSGFSETDRVREALRLGAGQYVKKPYTMEKIGMAVKKELRE